MNPQGKQFENFKRKKINDMEDQKIDLLALAAALFDATQKITILDGRLTQLAQKVIDENQQLAERISLLESQMMAVMADEKQAGLN
jgi:hypothetical protein